MGRIRISCCAAIMAIGLFYSCADDNNNPNRSNGPSSVNLDITSDDVTWETENVVITDEGLRTLKMSAFSTTGGEMEFDGILFQGVGTFDATDVSSGIWYMTPSSDPEAPIYSGGDEGPTSGTITILDHDPENDLISGSFDIYLTNVSDANDQIHLTGSFFDLELSPGKPVQSNSTVVLNDSTFTYDYAMIFQIDDFMYLQMVNNIDEIVTVRWNRTDLGENVYDITQQAPIRVHYRNGAQIFTQQVEGNIDVTSHSALSPGGTSGSYVVEISDFGSPPQFIEGSFNVNYY